MRTTFPTLADVERSAWPDRLRITPRDPLVGGDVERIMCGCYRVVPASEMVDLRALSEAERTRLGIHAALQCAACFHHAQQVGATAHEAIARALGLHPDVIASLASGTREAIRRGWHPVTPSNRHLAR